MLVNPTSWRTLSRPSGDFSSPPTCSSKKTVVSLLAGYQPNLLCHQWIWQRWLRPRCPVRTAIVWAHLYHWECWMSRCKTLPILVDSASDMFCPVVPACSAQWFRLLSLTNLRHYLAHPGIRTILRLVTSHFVWPCLSSQVVAWCQDFLQCQQAKDVPCQPHATGQPSTYRTGVVTVTEP